MIKKLPKSLETSYQFSTKSKASKYKNELNERYPHLTHSVVKSNCYRQNGEETYWCYMVIMI